MSYRVIFVLLITFIIALLTFFIIPKGTYNIAEYFPTNENDLYVYNHSEGLERDLVNITVKNVVSVHGGKQFSFLWQGKYNDRIQTNILTPKGIIFCRNEHLVGEAPLRAIKSFYPPLLMIPGKLSKAIIASTLCLTHDMQGKIIFKEDIEALISFVGKEEISVGAGKFQCLHFFIRHNYKDVPGTDMHMHTYNFWIAPRIGIVKFIHTFVPFRYVDHINPDEKNIMNRYNSSFVAFYELKKAIIGGRTIGR